MERLRSLEQHASDTGFQARWRDIKRSNKARLAGYIREHTGIELDSDWIFDVQVKRIHEYKRQHLSALHIVSLYQRLKQDPRLEFPPRVFIFGGKAAPDYFVAKRIIKLINDIATVVNADKDANQRLRVAFVPNFCVKVSEIIYPAADVSEQISTAGKEASGTGNMKFAMNGAVTIGTLDGVNIEIRDQVGEENFFLFGLTADEVRTEREKGYRPRDVYDATPPSKPPSISSRADISAAETARSTAA